MGIKNIKEEIQETVKHVVETEGEELLTFVAMCISRRPGGGLCPTYILIENEEVIGVVPREKVDAINDVLAELGRTLMEALRDEG